MNRKKDVGRRPFGLYRIMAQFFGKLSTKSAEEVQTPSTIFDGPPFSKRETGKKFDYTSCKISGNRFGFSGEISNAFINSSLPASSFALSFE